MRDHPPPPHTEERFKEALTATARAIARRKDVDLSFDGNHPLQDLQEDPHIKLSAIGELSTAQTVRQLRGEADLAALSLRFHNAELHHGQRPKEEKAAAIYDALELMRVELLGSHALYGMRHNLSERLNAYCDMQGYHRLSERSDPPLADILAVMLREQVLGEPPPAALERLVTLWQPWVESKAGDLFDNLHHYLAEQDVFAVKVRELLQHLSADAQSGGDGNDATEEDGSTGPDKRSDDDEQEMPTMQAVPSLSPGGKMMEIPSHQLQKTVFAPSGEEEEHSEHEAPKQSHLLPNFPAETHTGFQYHIYSAEFDEVVTADKLTSPEELTRLRDQLDQKLQMLPGISSRLSNKLQRMLLAKQARRWLLDQEDGILNAGRLAYAVARPDYPYLYKIEEETDFKDTIVTLLIDNSGSMRGRPITVAALSVDILARTLERCGVKVEILGFTTRDWKGGQARKAWMDHGKPANPGRLNDLRHIIYKSAEIPLRRARKNLGLMLKDGLLKENIDGEAILWAHNRLMARPEERRILMVVSDGAPVDDSTLSVNSGTYLDMHLRQVIQWIENTSPVELLAIGIGHDVTRYYRRAVTLSDAEHLGDTMLKELTKLFENED